MTKLTTDDLRQRLATDPRDAGCAAGVLIMDHYVELELAGEHPEDVFPGTAAHLRSCPACRTDHDGLLELARQLGDPS